MTEPVSAPPAHRTRWGLLATVGVLAIGAVAAYVAQVNGAFRTHEKVAILTWNQDAFWDFTQQGAADAAKELGVELTFVKSEPTLDAQNGHFKKLLDAGNAALAISPNDPKQQESLINDAAAKAVVLTFDSDAPNTKRRGFVGTDDYLAGQIAAEEIRAAVPDGGQVIISVGSLEMSNGRLRRQGVIDDLLDRPLRRDAANDPADAKLDGKTYQVVATVLDNGDPAKAVSGIADALKANPDAKAVVGLFSYSGAAAVKAVEAAGAKDKVKVVAFDETPEVQQGVQGGAIYSSIVQNQYRCGYETVRSMADLLRGTAQGAPEAPRVTALSVAVMKSDNIDDLRRTRVVHTPAK